MSLLVAVSTRRTFVFARVGFVVASTPEAGFSLRRALALLLGLCVARLLMFALLVVLPSTLLMCVDCIHSSRFCRCETGHFLRRGLQLYGGFARLFEC